ncbi:DUF4328 domain-containing protein [Promicromonospora sp. NPDC060271]|uniref:DUF4328 domain-containing protein n=1 Tax=Promicromonospora sp. NPDC060271 TaxID=3347089 RepID=UPI00365D63A5
MSDPRTPHQNGAAPWGGPVPQRGRQSHPEQLGSPAHPQSPYAEPQYPEPQYPEHYAGASTGQHTGPPTPVSGQQRVPVGRAQAPARRRTSSKPLPEPPAGLAVGTTVAACCLLFVELADLAILVFTGGRGEASGINIGLGVRVDPNGATVALLFGLAAYVAACVWLQASRRFAEAWNPAARFARGPAWTWLGWLVPVAFLWVPFQVVRDIRDAVLPDGQRRVALGLWWTFWLVSGLRVFTSSDQVAEIVVRSVAAVALTVAAIHWVRIVRETTTAQEKAAGFA